MKFLFNIISKKINYLSPITNEMGEKMHEYKEHTGINNNNNNNEKWTKNSLVDCPNLYNQLNPKWI